MFQFQMDKFYFYYIMWSITLCERVCYALEKVLHILKTFPVAVPFFCRSLFNVISTAFLFCFVFVFVPLKEDLSNTFFVVFFFN